ncbi:MAG: DUF4270 family protein, partial [Chryseobacterium sp.]|nr:DUF4270 family protein [Chryseobacterium sp.]
MIKIKTLMKMVPFLAMGIVVLNSCEGELDNLGSQLVDGNAADGYDKAYSLIAYNIDNSDLIRADASRLDSVRIGAFSESVFGGQKASYITQLRLNTYDPDFGTNPVIDSVVLTLKPSFSISSATIRTKPLSLALWSVTLTGSADCPFAANSIKPLSPSTPSERVLERSIWSGLMT